MTLTERFEKELRRTYREISLFLAKIEKLNNNYVTAGMSADARDAAEKQAFPAVKKYAIPRAMEIMERTEGIATAARMIPKLLTDQANKQGLPPETVAEIQAAAKEAANSLNDFFLSMSRVMFVIYRQLEGNSYPWPTLEHLNMLFSITPGMLTIAVETRTRKLQEAEALAYVPANT